MLEIHKSLHKSRHEIAVGFWTHMQLKIREKQCSFCEKNGKLIEVTFVLIDAMWCNKWPATFPFSNCVCCSFYRFPVLSYLFVLSDWRRWCPSLKIVPYCHLVLKWWKFFVVQEYWFFVVKLGKTALTCRGFSYLQRLASFTSVLLKFEYVVNLQFSLN